MEDKRRLGIHTDVLKIISMHLLIMKAAQELVKLSEGNGKPQTNSGINIRKASPPYISSKRLNLIAENIWAPLSVNTPQVKFRNMTLLLLHLFL